MSIRFFKAFSILLTGVGLIWLNAKAIGAAASWLAEYIGYSEGLESIRKPLNVLFGRLSSIEHSVLVVEFGPWLLIAVGLLVLVVSIIGQYFSRLQRKNTTEKLAKVCDDLAADIASFMQQRQSQEPRTLPGDLATKTNEELDRDIAEAANFSSQTTVLYAEQINPKLKLLHSMLIKHNHRPNEGLAFGDDSWANRKTGKLRTYARLIRQGELIVDDEGANHTPFSAGHSQQVSNSKI